MAPLEDSTQETSPENDNVGPLRLLIISNRARNMYQINQAVLPNIMTVHYKYEESSLDSITGAVIDKMGTRRAQSIGFIMHGIETELYICAIGQKELNIHTWTDQLSIREFFSMLTRTYLDVGANGSRIDFYGTSFNPEADGKSMREELEAVLQVPVGIHKDLIGAETQVTVIGETSMKEMSAGELYFNLDKIKESAAKMAAVPKPRTYNKDHYEKIRTVGKGAFGTAILFRRLSDDLLVVIKEINMHDLTGSERQLAMNEIKVLSLLGHANIITYLDSFEDDGILKIEMEYADGGNLAEYLQQRDDPMDEREVLILFHQTVSAIRHMHDHNILHRDLKTANILLTKEGVIKVGDFGISKMMTTRHKANTVVGTPYYISPEMCEGKTYDEKSDIWALGCILYEMVCLQKTFEGSNLPALVNKIMKGQFAPVKGNYSHGLKQLIRDLLQRDPLFRPTAAEILQYRLPELLAQFLDDIGDIGEEMQNAIQEVQKRQQNDKSVIYHIRTFESTITLTPIPLPPKTKVSQLAVSGTHMIALTTEFLVYTWGDGRRGQLGHGLLETWRVRPECVAALKGKSITKVCAGDGFSVFASNSGIVMTCGDGTCGCLGHGDWNCSSRPKLIEKLLSVDVSAIDCGPSHVVVIGGEGEVYSWGRGASGRLGLGHEDDCCAPEQVKMPQGINVKDVTCGVDGTMFLTDIGAVLACGNNKYNKLGLNENGSFLKNMLMNNDIDKSLVPTSVKALAGFKTVQISMGPNHTAVQVVPTHLITFGRNSEGQLGRGHTRSSINPSFVKPMLDKTITMIECGETYTVVGTIENVVYLWGTRYVMCAPTRPPTQDTTRAFLCTSDLQKEENDQKNGKIQKNEVYPKDELTIQNEINRTNRDDSKTPSELDTGFTLIKENSDDKSHSTLQKEIPTRRNQIVNSIPPSASSKFTVASGKSSNGPRMKDVLLHPEEILALYASPAQISKGETVNLSGICCQDQNIYIVVDTTAPLPRHGRRRIPTAVAENSAINGSDSVLPEKLDLNLLSEAVNAKKPNKDDDNIPSKDIDTMGPVPNWLKQELENSDPAWLGQKENPGNRTNVRHSAFARATTLKQTRSPQELKLELERLRKAKGEAETRLAQVNAEFQVKQTELKTQAEQKVQERERALTQEIERLQKELQEQKKASQVYSQQIQSVQDELQNQPTVRNSNFCIIQ